jgi:peptidoglycan/LPS O-acetylase OafA/YrhL
VSSGQRRRILRLLPFVALALLLGAWALCIWGNDESLLTVLATHLPFAAYGAIAVSALVASAVARSVSALLAAVACLPLAVVQLGGYTMPSRQTPAAAGSSSHEFKPPPARD